MSSVIILGATGRFGRAASHAFTEAGWRVTHAARRWPAPDATHANVDPTDPASLAHAAAGHDIIVNAINPPYHHWADQVPLLTANVIRAAQDTGATVMIPGNIYNYGADMPMRLTEDTPWVANTKKGGIRISMENAFRDSDVPTVILRGGDFIEAARSEDWFGHVIAGKAWDGYVTYPGPRDMPHAWAWLPDMARAMVGLAKRRADFARFEEFGFPGFALTGNDLISLIERAVGRPVKVRGLPWPMVRLAGLWTPMLREVIEMRYLWNKPHAIDGRKLMSALPDLRLTPPDAAIAAALAPFGKIDPRHGTLSFSAPSA